MNTHTPQDLMNSLNYLNDTKSLMKNAIENKGQVVAENLPFRGYANLIENIVTASGEVYNFGDIDEMYNCRTANIGDFAVVTSNYIWGRDTLANDGETALYGNIYVPETVTLPVTVNETDGLRFYSNLTSGTSGSTFNISPNEAFISLNMGALRNPKKIQYSSLDGKTYSITGLNRFSSSEYTYDANNHQYIINFVNLFENNMLLFYSQSRGNNYPSNDWLHLFLRREDMPIFYGLYQYNGSNWNKAEDDLMLTPIDSSNLSKGAKEIYLNTAYAGSVGFMGDGLYANNSPISLEAYADILSGAYSLDKVYLNDETIFPMIRDARILKTTNIADRNDSYLTNTLFDVSNVTNFYHVFSNSQLNFYDILFQYGVTHANIEDMSYTFTHCSNITSMSSTIHGNLPTNNTTNMMFAFYNCRNLTNVIFSSTRNVTDMSFTFHSCINMVNSPSLDTENVLNMAYMFAYCNNLVSVMKYNTINVKSMAYMFTNCNKLVTVANFNTINAENMAYMFANCNTLNTAPNFNTSKVTSMVCMFNNCVNLKNISLYYAPLCKNIEGFCYNCNNLTTASIHNVINMAISSAVIDGRKNLSNANTYSPFYGTNITNSRYSNRLAELTAAGWSY